VPSPARWPAIVYGLLSWAGAFYHLILFAFLKPDVQGSLDLSRGQLAWIDGLTFAAAALGGLVLGRAADLGARRLVLALAPVVPAAGSLLLAHADGPGAAFVARLVVGFGVGGGWGVGHAVLADLYDGPKRLRAAAILQTGGPIGVMAAALVGAVLIPAGPDGWRSVLTWSAVTAAIAALDPWAMRAAGPPASGPPGLGPPALAGPTSLAAAPPIPPAAYRIFLLLVLQMTAYWCTFAWLPSHLLSQGASRATVGWIQIGTGFTQGLADLLFGWLSPRVGVRRLFALCNLAFGAGVLVLAASFATVASSALALAAVVAAVGLGSGSWAAFGPLFARHVPSPIRSSVSSTSYHLARASLLPVHVLLGAFAASATSQTPSLVVAALAAWGGALAIRGLPGERPA
jgi:MFS family permease